MHAVSLETIPFPETIKTFVKQIFSLQNIKLLCRTLEITNFRKQIHSLQNIKLLCRTINRYPKHQFQVFFYFTNIHQVLENTITQSY